MTVATSLVYREQKFSEVYYSEMLYFSLGAKINIPDYADSGNQILLYYDTVTGEGSILLETPTSPGVKTPNNRSYASAEMIRSLDNENLESYNRINVWVKSEAEGFYSAFAGVTLYNDGLKDITTRQPEYIVGYNPFALSTIYGEGYDYPNLYGGYPGDVAAFISAGPPGAGSSLSCGPEVVSAIAIK